MPKLTEEFRQERRRHILRAAWRCFSRDGFHATSMDDVIRETGLSSSAVYRYISSKEELVDEAARESLGQVMRLLDGLLEADPPPSVTETLRCLAQGVDEAAGQEYDLTRIAMQSWAEALRRPELAGLARDFHRRVRDRLTDLAARWVAAGYLSPRARPTEVATVLGTLLPGLIVNARLVDGISAEALASGLASLGAGAQEPIEQ
ncbi:TetR/AcrR family transcriptional regulator [Streptomyces phaeofaciens JCM 4814]|uniref:TetR family transcriptional regulator n=1 Tax=Streptomyces phaeofaciens TaxID=68254 RepID=A0A918HRZ3_9ACTN|nr:TetR/AcrR family transcriptional regulator [Streptomyces phaeofaciens]GGT96930.1 TetR family transcriptional regulator [Streptomyces phaeofaciens]